MTFRLFFSNHIDFIFRFTLAEANVGLAMNSGTMSAKEAANLIDLDSNPTKLMEVVLIGKQLLMTRGSLTTNLH
jgi:K+-transporting ATPase ATPase B chain